MAVKPLRSATRVLAVLEAVAAHQPVGLTAVTRLLDEDKSAVQRALATLAEDGWIRPASGDPPRWELTTRSLVMAAQATSRVGLRQQARPVMEALRDRTDESVLLAVPDPPRVVTLDVVESRQLVRAAPHVGLVLPNGTERGEPGPLRPPARRRARGLPRRPARRRARGNPRRRAGARLGGQPRRRHRERLGHRRRRPRVGRAGQARHRGDRGERAERTTPPGDARRGRPAGGRGRRAPQRPLARPGRTCVGHACRVSVRA